MRAPQLMMSHSLVFSLRDRFVIRWNLFFIKNCVSKRAAAPVKALCNRPVARGGGAEGAPAPPPAEQKGPQFEQLFLPDA